MDIYTNLFTGSLGLANSLCKHLENLTHEYRCVLVDEMQDFGTIEYKIIRRLVKPGQNDIFLCGDLSQSVLTKHHKLSEAGIDIAGRSNTIKKNYRNSREILEAAFDVFQKNSLKRHSSSVAAHEILYPEYANFSSAPPLLIEGSDLIDEISHSLGHFSSRLKENKETSLKFCLAICGMSQSEIEALALQIDLPVLTGNTDVVAGTIFLSDLEQTKGFEFDSIIIVNCSDLSIPHPTLPPEESFRELSKLYVAMTRAKTELIISFSNAPSSFLSESTELFTFGKWPDYAEPALINNIEMPIPHFSANPSMERFNLSAKDLLRCPEAVGLSAAAQEKIRSLVDGQIRYQNKRPVGWKSFREFFEITTKTPTLRSVNNISDQMWQEITEFAARLRCSENRPIITIRKLA